MAKIPDKYSLSAQPSLRSGRQVATYDVSGIGRGIQQFAQGVGDLGNALVQEKADAQQQQNAVDIARAEAEKTKGLLGVQNTFENDPDYSTFNERGGKQVDEAIKGPANLIRDPKMRERWMATQQEAAVRAKDWLTDQATDKRRSAEVVALDDANKTNYNLIIDPNTPDDVRSKARADIDANLAVNEHSGLLSPAEASKRRELFVQGAYDQQALLAAESGKLNLPDPDALTQAMISVESQNNPNAVSPKGALGVMQVMPSTAVDIARELGDKNFPTDPEKQKEYLKDRDVSIRYGQRYISNLLTRYNGDEEAALIAYNGGMERADKWLAAGRDDSVIPQETSDYYKKVMAGSSPQSKADANQISVARSYLQAHTDKDASHINGLQGDFSVKLSNLLQAAPPEIRDKLGVFSGARTTERQRELWQAALKKYGSVDEARRWVAPPGRSNHNKGLAADLSYDGKSLADAPPEVVTWLHDNASKYGLAFPLGNENWHVEDAGARSHSLKSYPAGWDKVSPQMRQRVIQVADAQQKQAETQQLAVFKANQQQARDDFNLQIAVNPAKVTQNDILTNPMLDNGDKATLINSLNGAMKENQGVNEFINALGTGDTISVNPFDKDQTKIADKAFDQMLSAAPEDKRPLITSAMISQTGYIPEKVQSEIRRGMVTTSVPDMAAALQTTDNIAKLAPNSILSMAGHEQVQKNLTAYRHYAFDMGYSAEEAARKVISLNDPAMAAQRDAIMKSKPIADAIKKVDASTVADLFDISGPFSPNLGDAPTQRELSVGYSPESEAAIVEDYRSIFEESIADAGGDTALGKKMADERFQRLYGTSGLTMAGDKSVVKLPPEKAYPADVNGSHDYIRQQAIADLKAEGIDATDVFLQPYDQTERDVSAGRPANYQLFYMKDGKLEKLPNPFTADPATANQDAIKKSSEIQTGNLAVARSDEKFYDEIRKARAAASDQFKDYPEVFRMQKMREAEQNVRDNAAQSEQVPDAKPSMTDDIVDMPTTDAMGN